jgi:hypothetical protein
MGRGGREDTGDIERYNPGRQVPALVAIANVPPACLSTAPPKFRTVRCSATYNRLLFG